MKAINIFLLGLLILTSSCSKEEVIIEEAIDFTGIYSGHILCQGSLSEDNGNMMVLVISKDLSTNNYKVDFGDGVIFTTQLIENNLRIDKQTINEELEFDVITIEATITLLQGNQFKINFYHQVDDEGSSNCTSTLTKE